MDVKIPEHIGIILDGNRRLAKRLMMKPWEGHKLGVKKAIELLEWACEKGIKYVTAYVLSYENLKKRPKTELKWILKYLEDELDSVIAGKHVVHGTKTKIKFIGRIHLLPIKLIEKMKEVERITRKYKDHILNIAVAYGGQQEIVDAFRKLGEKISAGILKPYEITEKMIKKSLYTNGSPYPDLIIRTGGERRLSNFLTWQSAYSELFFIDKMWPEVTKRDFEKILKEFSKRKRRFGK